MGRGSSVERLPQYVSAFTDRHGKRRYRFRKRGVSVYLKEHPGTPKHPSAEYKLLLEGARSRTTVDERVLARWMT